MTDGKQITLQLAFITLIVGFGFLMAAFVVPTFEAVGLISNITFFRLAIISLVATAIVSIMLSRR